ncbi:DUF4238 domain-containing protein, partial [Magnetospirillum sp. SS-4]|uniref:DUF4238 domain-containing protein n=1 Tax=Magnetospirillum sp. SS-4 TaxID=2681465 RepID=UPI001572D2BD
MSDPVKHHFVPQFYLNAWCDADGKVLYFRRRNGLVVSRRIPPKYTGYEDRLYSLNRVPAEHQQIIEREFFSKEVDGKAGRIIPTLL